MHLKHIPVGFGLHRWAATLGAVLIAMLFTTGSAEAANAPAWSLTATSAPTNFAAGETGTQAGGPLYLFEATNVGGAPTSTPVTLQATLPAGVRPSDVTAGIDDLGVPDPSCSISLQVVTCTTPVAVRPGNMFGVTILVDTAAALSGVVSSEAMVSGGGALPATTAIQTSITSAAPRFGFLSGSGGLASSLTAADGSPVVLAGSHPHQLTVGIGFPVKKAGPLLHGAGHPRNVYVDLPGGLIVNPTATPVLCTEEERVTSRCPLASQVGVATATVSVTGVKSDSRPLYNMIPPPGSAANFAFDVGDLGVSIHLLGSVRTGDYGFSASAEDLPALQPMLGLRLQLWGDPSSPSHDAARGAPVPPQPRALLTLPSACGPPLVTTAWADSWEEPGVFVSRGVENQDLEGNPSGVSGCGALGFSPSLEARPTTRFADSPSGFDVRLEVPQTEAPEARATASAKRARVTLPEGLVANPSGANGLTGCSPAQAGLISPVGLAPGHFDGEPASCPGAARVGTVEVDTPLLAHPLQGSVFLASPHSNPFGTMLALYVIAEDLASGVVLKLAGEVETDPASGRLTVGFDQLPQLPITKIELRFFGGATAPLRTPAICGEYATTSSLSPWSAPESGLPATPVDSYPIDRAPAGAVCARSADALPNSPSFVAGTVAPAAGGQTPFVFAVKRDDGTQQLSSVTLNPPPGLVAKLAGTTYCPEASLVAAAARPGTFEQADPSCPSSSRVGEAAVGAGAGPLPYYVHGHAYLAGPYKGAPLSLAIVVPAVAGPYDLGTVVVRSALYLDPGTARVTAVSDPIPSILEGIPLDVRSLRVTLDKPGLIRNPTSCNSKGIGATVASPMGQSSTLSSRFQVGECGQLGFKPRVSLRLFGPTHRGAHPRLRTILTARPGDANVRRLAIVLPGTELLDNRHIGAVCAREQFATRHCPAGSVQGYARAWSPLLGEPLKGPVYLRASDSKLPDLAASLRGQVDLDLVAQLDSVRGRLRTTFRALPDVPLNKVVLALRGGERGSFVNTGGLCASRRRATVELDGQNGREHDIDPVVKTNCRRARRG